MLQLYSGRCLVVTFANLMSRKIRVAILFGGKSAEHEVSLRSAKNIIASLDKNKYEPVLIGIDKKGGWHLNEASKKVLNANNPKLLKFNTSEKPVALVPERETGALIHLSNRQPAGKIDVVFPILHGPYGEDGTIQGLLKLANIPFVGAGVLGSAVGMDKDVMKRLLREAGIPTAKFVVVNRGQKISPTNIARQLGLPLFIKPANLGSSVGVSKIKSKDHLKKALAEAFWFDSKVLIEGFVPGREIECAVLGNENPIASVAGEVIPQHGHEFYSYDAKYIDPDGALLKIPVELPKHILKKVQQMAIAAFKALCLEGMARVDFFLKPNGKVIVNEVNTIPGFTNISMYPKLWEASGISPTELIDRLIQLAQERHAKEKKLKTSYLHN